MGLLESTEFPILREKREIRDWRLMKCWTEVMRLLCCGCSRWQGLVALLIGSRDETQGDFFGLEMTSGHRSIAPLVTRRRMKWAIARVIRAVVGRMKQRVLGGWVKKNGERRARFQFLEGSTKQRRLRGDKA